MDSEVEEAGRTRNEKKGSGRFARGACCMANKVGELEDRILHFIQESLHELDTIRREESDRLEKTRNRFRTLTRELRDLAAEIDRAFKEYEQLREELMRHSQQGALEQEKAAYERASQSMKVHASLEERYRILSAHKEELQREERTLERLVSRSESMGTRLRMVMNLVSLPEEFSPEQGAIRNEKALAMAFQIAEREARSFARELHDGPTQSFSAAGLSLEMAQELLARGDGAAASGELNLAVGQLRTGLSEVRSLLFGLSPTGIESGFELPLRRLAEQVRQMWGVEVSCKLTGKLDEVPVSQRSNVFKTLHQAVINAARNGAANIRVSIGSSKRTLKVLVMDDGRGFDVERERQAARERGSYGLQNMEERVTIQGGNFSISSTPGKGTTVSFAIPLRDTE